MEDVDGRHEAVRQRPTRDDEGDRREGAAQWNCDLNAFHAQLRLRGTLAERVDRPGGRREREAELASDICPKRRDVSHTVEVCVF